MNLETIAKNVADLVDAEFAACKSFERPEFLYRRVTKVVEKELIERVMYHQAGNQSRACEVLGITRNTLIKRIGELGLKRKGDKSCS